MEPPPFLISQMAESSSVSSSPSRFIRPITQPIADRIFRALRHRLRLLHRSDSDFFIFGATGNVYKVTLSLSPSCSCPDRTNPCKHILFVLIRVLGISLDDPILRRSRRLRPVQLSRLLSTPILGGSFAGSALRERFHRLFSQAKSHGGDEIRPREGAVCPVCLEEMRNGERAVGCGTCKNLVHGECFERWKRASRGRRSISCVICRARWRDNRDEKKYVNLGAYASEEDEVEGGRGGPPCAQN